MEQRIKEVVIFARVSSEDKGDYQRQSYERQINDLTEYASRNNMIVKKIFAEKISGARKNDERPELISMISYISQNKIDKVLTSELSRIGRNPLEVLKTIDILNQHKISLFIQNYNIETLTDEGKINPMSEFLITILAEIARMERKTIQERMYSGYHSFRLNGGKVGRKQGYVKSDAKLLVEYVEEVKLLRKGYSLRNIAKITGRSVSTVQKIKAVVAKQRN